MAFQGGGNKGGGSRAPWERYAAFTEVEMWQEEVDVLEHAMHLAATHPGDVDRDRFLRLEEKLRNAREGLERAQQAEKLEAEAAEAARQGTLDL